MEFVAALQARRLAEAAGLSHLDSRCFQPAAQRVDTNPQFFGDLCGLSPLLPHQVRRACFEFLILTWQRPFFSFFLFHIFCPFPFQLTTHFSVRQYGYGAVCICLDPLVKRSPGKTDGSAPSLLDQLHIGKQSFISRIMHIYKVCSKERSALLNIACLYQYHTLVPFDSSAGALLVSS